ncbi:DUF637 domain-containing protein [Pseudomonas entomophila]|uniref:two-partner secretion domain-containing protein n=1 Tax=Pseudomonas entomophila TaxID=312306 RepID=UPI001BCE9BF1|nr:DUF637 domain-containing protein [Pseudomonas entomophila]QVM90054.1 DUF637 domain-containing protein [Pseudomonas entomophila]
MDVRLFAFLARQRSAEIQPRAHFCGLPKRGLAFLLANVMFWQPLWAQAAEGIAVSGAGTSLGQAGNGVPIVNIATPNGSGLSHNQFSDYNVGQQGLILNNATARTQATQLGGIILGNPNLQGQAASTIINEVNGANASQLRGYTEVAGQSAKVIVANAHGIACDGCGFINTPQATLTTGKPVIENGQLSRYQVDQGHIAIEGAGVNASNVDSFELIARSTKINAEIQARNLAIVAGRNDVDARTLTATARQDDGSVKPTLAIDSSALGGMYAGAVRLVGTEAGVGVRLDGRMIASGGDIQLDANGQLSMAQASAAGDVRVQAAGIDAQGPVHAGQTLQMDSRADLVNRAGLTAVGQVRLDASGQLSNLGGVQAGIRADGSRAADADLKIDAGAVDNHNQRLIASRDLTLTSADRLNNQGGSLSAGRDVNIKAVTLDNRQQGKVIADGRMTLGGGQLFNGDGGKVTSQGALSATWALLDNQSGELSGLDALALNLGSLDNRNGRVLANRGITVTSQGLIDNRAGRIDSQGTLELTAQVLDNSQGGLARGQTLDLAITQAVDNRQGTLAAGKVLTLKAASLDNREQGKLLSDGTLTTGITGLLDNQGQGLASGLGATRIEAGRVDNRGGRLVGKDLLTLEGQHWDNRGGKIEATGALTLTVDNLDNRDQGLVSGQAWVRYNGNELLNQLGIFGARGNLTLVAAHLNNSGGSLTSGGDLDGRVARVEQLGGKLSADGELTLRGSSLVNRQGAVVGAGQGMRLTVGNVDNRGGELSTAKALSLTGEHLDNSAGQVLADTALTLTVAEVINRAQGLLRGKGQLTLDGQTLDNRDGRLSGEQGARLRLGQALSNGKGLLTSEGDLDIGAASLDNTDGELTSAGTLTLATTGEVGNLRGSVTADGTLDLRSASLDNRAGEIGSQGAIDIVTGALDNRDNGHVVGNDRLTIKAGQVRNAGRDSRIDSDGAMVLTASGLDQQAGRLLSKTSITLDLGQGTLTNHGLVKAPTLVLNNLGKVDNQHGEITSPQGFTLAATSLDNQQGRLLSEQALIVRIAQAVANTKGLISAKGLDLQAASLDNHEGIASSRASLVLTIDQRLDNRQGTLVGDTSGHLSAKTLDNAKGKISGKGYLQIEADTLVNAAGSLVGLEQLRIKGTQLDNREAGLLGSNGTMTLDVDQVDNRGGEISGKAAVSVTGTQLENSDGGQLVVGTGLTLALQQLLNRRDGRIEAQTGLTLTGQTLDNDGGHLASQQDLALTLTGAALNRLGLISAEGQLTLKALRLDNDTGTLTSAGSLRLTTEDDLSNKGGKLLSDSGITLTSASFDNTDKGVLSGKGALRLTTGHLDNSRQGSIGGDSTLVVQAGQLDNRDGGRVGSHEDLTATITGLDQQGGKLFSDRSVHLDLGHGHLDNRGGLINAPLLVLDNLKTVANQAGEISSDQAFTLTAEQLDNNDGRLLGNQGLLLRVSQRLDNLKGLIGAHSLEVHAGVLDNSGGTLNSQSGMTLTVDGLLRNRGLVEARDALTLASLGLDNQGGKLLGSAIALDLGGASLDNGKGLISTAGQLTLDHLGMLDNQAGELSTAQGLRFDATGVDNRGGKLISEQKLTLNSGVIDNQGGLISGWQGLKVIGQSLDNRQQGTLSSRFGAVQADVTGALRNSAGGALVAQQRLDVTAASLDNSAKGVLSSAGAQHLTVGGTLDNRDGGLIDAGERLDIDTQSLDNRGGRVASRQALSLTGASLDNSDGSLATEDALSLDLLGDLLNQRGKLYSGKALLVQRASLIDNQGGQVASQGLLKLIATRVDNSLRGTLAANGQLVVNSTGVLSNAGDGLIYSQQGDVSLQAASLGNSKGTVQAKGAINVQTTADVDNQGGKLIAQDGALDVAAASIDNRGGILASLKQSLGVRTTGVLRNGSDANGQRGTIQALSLDLQSAMLDNHGGRMAATSGDALIRTGELDNRDGALSAGGLLKLDGASLRNGGDARGEMLGQRIEMVLSGALDNRGGIIESASTLDITAASLDNRQGQLRALGGADTSRFQIGGVLDNRDGKLETANRNLALAAGDLLNANGTILHVGLGDFGISSQQVMAAGGRLSTRGTLTLNADSWTNSSVLQAGTLKLNVGTFNQTASGQLLATNALIGSGGNWHNDGLIASDGSFSLTLSGRYSGDGRLASLADMTLSAAQMNLGRAGSIAGGGNVGIDIAGQLINEGRLSAASDLTLRAAGITNHGAIAASRDLVLTADTVLNEQAADGSRGFLFSGRDMAIRAGDFTNRYADVYSLGNLLVAGVAPGSAAAKVLNSSGTIEAGVDIDLQASSFVNERNKFRATESITGGYMTIWCVQHCGSSGWVRGPVFVYKTESTVVHEDSPMATLVAGHDLDFNGGTFSNSRSVVSAGNDLTLTAGTITNEGTRSSSGTSKREIGAGSKIPSRYFNQLIAEVDAYNQAHPQSGPFDEAAFKALLAKFDVAYFYDRDKESTLQNDGQFIAPAIIQAGGMAKLNATYDINNVVVQHSSSSLSNKAFNTQVSSATPPTVVRLNAQLPPDLAHKQVDPTALPGFSLPVGQNGLFRLSGQGNNTANGLAPQWTLGNASLAVTQRQALAGSHSGSLQALDATTSTLSEQQIERVAHLGSAPAGKASAIGVYAPVGTAVDATQGRGSEPLVGTPPQVPGITRMPDTQYTSQPHKYLIETNPVLTELKQFMSSDYLLGNLGYDPDKSWKRLGDGFYEQRLIQQAVVARTGQQFIDGQTSGEQLYKQLMDNAVRSKTELNLSLGVGLTSAQVAALTHDIVWLEEREFGGEKVLAPVLYLAHANNRLGPDGALIAGQDMQLLAGRNLDNVGTLHATRGLSAVVGNDLENAGLIESGGRLDLLAGNNMVNHAGGIITGRDVSVTTLSGDLINQRDRTRITHDYGVYQQQSDYLDSAARIEAGNDLLVNVGRDLLNGGSVLQAGRDLNVSTGRDIVISATERADHLEKNGRQLNGTVRQSVSQLGAGRDVTLKAGRDFAAIAGEIEAKRDIAIDAVGDMTLASAADEDHFYSKSKKLTIQEDHVRQVGTQLIAGGDVSLRTGEDMKLVSSSVTAGDAAYLYAGGDIELLAETDSDYSLYDKKSKGSWGKKKTQRDEVTDVRHVGSEITTGGDLTLQSGGDQRYQAAKLESGKDLTLESGGEIAFEGVKDLHQESHAKSSSSLAWNSAKGKGSTDETLRQSQLLANGEMVLKAADGVKVDLKHIDQQSVAQTIDAMVQADPQLAWLKEAEKRGDVDWRRVQEVHDSYKYSHSGLGQGAMLAIIIIVTVLTAGAASSAVGTAFAGAGSAGSGTVMAAGGISTVGASTGTFVAAGWGNAMVTAGLTSMASTSAVSAINNRGDLGAVLKEVTSSDNLKGYAVGAITAGITSGYLNDAFGISAENLSKPTFGFNLGTLSGLGKFAGYTGSQAVVGAVAKSALEGGHLGRNLSDAGKNFVGNALAAAIYKQLGDQLNFAGLPTKTAAHALVGGLLAEAAGGDFRSGAIAAGANEAFVATVGERIFPGDTHAQLLSMTSQLLGLTVAAGLGADEKGQQVAGWVAQNATQYNNLDHPTAERMLGELKECRATHQCTGAKIQDILDRYEGLSIARAKAMNACGTRECSQAVADSAVAIDSPVAKELIAFFKNTGYDTVGLLNGNPGQHMVPSMNPAGTGGLFVSDKQLLFAKFVKEGWLTPAEQSKLGQWSTETSWLDRAVGRQLTIQEKATLITELGTTGALAIMAGGRGGVAASGAGNGKAGGGKVGPGEGAKVPPCPRCFAAGTQVATPDGDRAIETLKVGDVVWSKPERGGKPFAAAITATHVRNDQPIYRLTLENIHSDGKDRSETLLVTPSHPFYVPAKHDFVPMGELRPGDLLQSLADGEGEGTSIRVVSARLYKSVGKTYNLTVDVGHTFYVGELRTWVHNTGGPCDITGNSANGAKGGAASSGAENAALYPKLKDQLIQKNLSNIAAQDSRLAAAVNGSGTKNPNFSIGQGTSFEANKLGKIWVGDGATKTSDGLGFISADGTRVYRPPTSKDSSFATTGVQANFETYKINPATGQRVKVSNGHLNVAD